MEKRSIYQPQPERPMYVAAFGSGTGTIVRAMLEAEKKNFAIKLLYTDRISGFQKIAQDYNLPLIYHPKDPTLSREAYDHQGLELLKQTSIPIDLLLLAGYMRLMSSVWLNAFPILNIHPADLTERKYIGANAVFHALQAGEKKTRTSAILIDETVDGGPIVALGPWVEYDGTYPITQCKAALHQEKQKKLSDWPVCLKALNLIGSGLMEVSNARIYLDGYELKGETCAESLEF